MDNSHQMIRAFISVLILLLPLVVQAEGAALSNQALEKTYRDFVKSIHDRKIEKVIGFVHPNGIVAGDELIPKDVVANDLRDPDSYLSQMLYNDDQELSDTLCEESGVSPLSIYEFYERFGEKYQVKILGFSSSKFFSVGGSVSSQTQDGVKCRYYLFANIFLFEKDGKYYLASSFE